MRYFLNICNNFINLIFKKEANILDNEWNCIFLEIVKDLFIINLLINESIYQFRIIPM